MRSVGLLQKSCIGIACHSQGRILPFYLVSSSRCFLNEGSLISELVDFVGFLHGFLQLVGEPMQLRRARIKEWQKAAPTPTSEGRFLVFNIRSRLGIPFTPYIPIPLMPPMPPGIAGLPLSSSGSSETMASVVSIRPAIEAAFCNAVRVTLAGSMTPALTRSS